MVVVVVVGCSRRALLTSAKEQSPFPFGSANLKAALRAAAASVDLTERGEKHEAKSSSSAECPVTSRPAKMVVVAVERGSDGGDGGQ